MPQRFHGTTKKTPLELHAEEMPHLLALPSLQFDTAQVVYRIVDTDGTIQVASNRYSVPWQHVPDLLPVRILADDRGPIALQGHHPCSRNQHVVASIRVFDT